MRPEGGRARFEIALWTAGIVLIAGLVAYIVFDAQRTSSSTSELSAEESRYVEAVATQQAEAFIVAIATQAAQAAVPAVGAPPPAAPPTPPVAAAPTMSAPTVTAPPSTPPTVAPPPPSIPVTPPTPVPPPPTVPPPAAAPLRFTADTVKAAVLTPLSLYVSGNYEDTAPTFCVPGVLDPSTNEWMVACVVRINPGIEDPQDVIVFVDDATGQVYCVQGCTFLSCLPTPLGCEWLYPVSP
jgi:hypothetical protein